MSKRSEFDLIAALQKYPQPSSAFVQLGIGDDCAVLEPEPGARLLISTDQLVEDVHFALDWMHPGFLGRKALRSALSDLSAMGGQARACFLSVVLPASLRGRFFDQLIDGLRDDCLELGLPLAGGDLSSGRQVVVSMTVVGSHDSTVLLRSGAGEGDIIGAVGRLGWARRGLELLGGQLWGSPPADEAEIARRAPDRESAEAVLAQLKPPVLLDEGRKLVAAGVRSAIDVSDGFGQDLGHILKASGVGAEVDGDRLAAAAPTGVSDRLAYALDGGEDYALVFTLPASTSPSQVLSGLDWIEVGRVTGESGELWISGDGRRRRYTGAGYDHFA